MGRLKAVAAFFTKLNSFKKPFMCKAFVVQVLLPKSFCSFYPKQRNPKSTPAFWVSVAESKQSGSEAADRPLRSPILLFSARFSLKMQEKTSFALVDKRGFFDGGGLGI